MDPISQLKEEHAEILRSFNEIHDAVQDKEILDFDVVSSFRVLKDVLTAHVDLEDRTVYLKLRTSKHEDLKKLSATFSGEMTAISGNIFAFFSRYQNKDISYLRKLKKFNDELAKIISRVKNRVEIEESVLFPTYTKYYR